MQNLDWVHAIFGDNVIAYTIMKAFGRNQESLTKMADTIRHCHNILNPPKGKLVWEMWFSRIVFIKEKDNERLNSCMREWWNEFSCDTAMTEDTLRVLAACCQNMRILCLSGCEHIGDSGLVLLAQNPSQVEKIVLKRCHKITDKGVVPFVKANKALTSISLSECDRIKDNSVIAIAENCDRVRHLNLSSCHQVTDIAMQKLAEGCTALKSLLLVGCSAITNDGILCFAKADCRLEGLSVIGCDDVTTEALRQLQERMPDIAIRTPDGSLLSV
jgi:hypothetical protein